METEPIVHGFEDVEGLEPYITHQVKCEPDMYVLCGGPGEQASICSHINPEGRFMCMRSSGHPGSHVGVSIAGKVQVWPNEAVPQPFAGCVPLVIPKEAFND